MPGNVVSGQVAGDLNASGAMTIVDAQLCYNLACGQFGNLSLLENQAAFLMADINGNHFVDASDAFALQSAVHIGWQKK